MALELLICERRTAVEYFPNYIGLMDHLSTAERIAKPKHPINICADSANTADKAKTKLIQEVFKMFFSGKCLYSDWGFIITLYVNGLRKNIHSKVSNTQPTT